jgi:putative oxidoreductase
MEAVQKLAHPAARVLLSLLFIYAGFGKITGGATGLTGYIDSVLPGFGVLAWPVAFFEFFGGIALLVGFQTRIVSLALAGFSIFTGLVFHGFSADQILTTLRNFGIAGGYLMFFAYGAGAYSIDNRAK